MTCHTNKLFLVLLAGLILTPVVRAEDPSDEDVREQLRAVQSEMAKLRAANERLSRTIDQMQSDQDSQWLNERRKEEVRSLVQDVLSDAEMRASLQGEGMTAGHNGKHFYLASADGSFLMQISGQIQIRHIYNNRDEDFADEDGDGVNDLGDIDEHESGFQIRRAKIGFDGHVGSPKIGYQVLLAASRSTNDVGVETVSVSYQLSDSLRISAGRRKLPFLREELRSSKRLMAVERASVTEVFTLNRSEGVWAYWDPADWVRVAVAITDGQNAGEIGGGPTGSNDFHADRTDFAITARADVKLAGGWKQMNDLAAWSGEPFAAFIGAAVHYELGETGDSDPINDPDYLAWTVDALVDVNGLSVMAALMGAHPTDLRSEDEFGDSTEFDRDHYGVLVQAGLFVIPNKLQPFARYEYITLEDASDESVNLVTVGANYFLNRHNAKFTFDVVYAFDPLTSDLVEQLGTGIGANGASSGLGLLRDNGDEDGQFAIRAQFQLLF